MVVAETLPQALGAAEAAEIEYEELPWIASSKSALSPGAPTVWDEVSDNALVDTIFRDEAADDRAFSGADHVVAVDLHIGRVTGVPIEPRAALGQYDSGTDRYTLCAGSGGPVRQKTELAAVLGVAPDRVRVLSYDVGGNFGVRNRVYVEFGLVLWAARKLGRPVKYTATRSEAFLSDFQGRDLVTRVALALRSDGRFLALGADNVSIVGARYVLLSPLGKGSALVTGSYDIPAASLRSRAVFTNTMPTNAYRSSGRPEVTYAIERLIDTAARELGFGRVELRRKNRIDRQMMPYGNAVGAKCDSGDYEPNMDLATRIADWGGFPARRREAENRGKVARIGSGKLCRIFDRGAANAPKSLSRRRAGPRSSSAIKQTARVTRPSFAQVVSALLAVPVDSIDLVTGDTDRVSLGGGSHSSRSMRHAATLFTKAAPELIAKGKDIAARILETTIDEIAFADGRFAARAATAASTLLELAQEAARLDVEGGFDVVIREAKAGSAD